MFNPWNRRPRVCTKTIGITGLIRSGKTVLLTSLISHLKNHTPQRLPIGGNGTQVIEVRTLPLPRGATLFDADRYRQELGRHRFPPKTLATHEYRAEYVRSDWSLSRLHLHFLEVPGELLADLAIATHARFDDWSDAVLRVLQQHEFARPAVDFLQALTALPSDSDPAALEQTLLRAYRTTLARMVLAYMPVVTPSSFLPRGPIDGLRENASQDETFDALVQNQICGLDRESQFCPLPAGLREANPALLGAFRRRYTAYRRQVVLPMARQIQRCDELIVLVDVAMLLEGGSGMVNANVLFLDQLLQAVDPGFSPPAAAVNRLCRFAGFRAFRGVRRLIFVATKADRVHPADRALLLGLLQDLVRPLVSGFQATRSLQVDYHVCSAVCCTRCPDPDRNVLHYLPEGADRESAGVQAEISRVPDEWPGDFTAGDYGFALPAPWMPKTLVRVPEQIDLHRIAEIVLS